MERISFRYINKDEQYGSKAIDMEMHDWYDEGLRCDEVCEQFVEFMESIGYQIKNILDYFRDE